MNRMIGRGGTELTEQVTETFCLFCRPNDCRWLHFVNRDTNLACLDRLCLNLVG